MPRLNTAALPRRSAVGWKSRRGGVKTERLRLIPGAVSVSHSAEVPVFSRVISLPEIATLREVEVGGGGT